MAELAKAIEFRDGVTRFEHIYNQDLERDSNVIEVLINHLRNKLAPELIKTRRGLGYQLIVLDDEP